MLNVFPQFFSFLHSEPGESSPCGHNCRLSGDWLVSTGECELFDCDDPQRAHVLQRSCGDMGVRRLPITFPHIHVHVHRSKWSIVLLTGMSSIYNTGTFHCSLYYMYI